jgi:putative transposase
MKGMTMTVAITRLDLTAADLRKAARQADDANAARRMLAIALLLEGWSREAEAPASAMDRQTLRDWAAHRCQATPETDPRVASRRNVTRDLVSLPLELTGRRLLLPRP